MSTGTMSLSGASCSAVGYNVLNLPVKFVVSRFFMISTTYMMIMLCLDKDIFVIMHASQCYPYDEYILFM